MTFVDIFFWNYLQSLAIFLPFSRLSWPPSSHIKLSWKMPEDTLRSVISDGENNTIFIFFHWELFVFSVNINSEAKICLFSQIEKIILIHIRSRGVWNLWYFYIFQVYLWQNLIFFWIVLFEFLDHPRIVYLIRWLSKTCICKLTETLKRFGVCLQPEFSWLPFSRVFN